MNGNTSTNRIPPDSGYPEPGGRAPAPAPLRLAQVFVNTADCEAGKDALGNPQDLVAWLASYGLVRDGEAATDGDLALAIDLREGMRSLFLTHHDGGLRGAGHNDDEHSGHGGAGHNGDGHRTPAPDDDAEGLRRLDRALEQLPLRVSVVEGTPGVVPTPQPPVRAALARIGAVLASSDPAQLRRLKACRRDVCRWVFFDNSRNRGGTWCAMEICGARTKMQTYRKRNA
ncbi:CGNR zinc finger domain-containing protein [Arthrobacter sp. zg-Y877]|uniref:CGNR zinc finger domain-containing protein n=1 Tax=Arthrobacter sp. zg-Y877 TaxID=3049074 RepID=UPI0025A496A1|nr:CGNR zinc finger domain-containing protein [Arthrobacter sp. zg-Y877]MDM7990150.1 CGNR zinc finger domain-containing protein [Arthrobacter sp. zg-Y877]